MSFFFKDLVGFFHDNPEAEAQKSYAHALPMACNSTLPARNFFGLLPKGYCERKPLKTLKYDI